MGPFGWTLLFGASTAGRYKKAPMAFRHAIVPVVIGVSFWVLVKLLYG